MRPSSIVQRAAIGRGVPLGGCLQKSGLSPLKKIEREREREKERKLRNFLCSALLPTRYTV